MGPAGSFAVGLKLGKGTLTHVRTHMHNTQGLRCICLSYRDYAGSDPARPADFFEDADQVDRDLIAVAIVGIKVRGEQQVAGGGWQS